MSTTPLNPFRPLLTTQGLTIGYRDGKKERTLLENLNLSLHQGELVCFMGSNGIGKSTLIRTLAGLQKPLYGNLSYNEVDVLPKIIAVVLTERITATHLTVNELITFGRYPYVDWSIKITASDKKIIDKAIQEVNIGHLVNDRLYQLSDGQLQMAMIARALAQDAPIILLDEPTAHLDLNNRVEIMNLLRRLTRNSNKAILVATHELDLALQMSDLIWLADHHKNIITGMPEDLVLNNSFDDIFKFKGFDLKTGKVKQQPYRESAIKIIASDYHYRWTRNALERNGFSVSEEAEISIRVVPKNEKPEWIINKNGETKSFSLLADLIISLQ